MTGPGKGVLIVTGGSRGIGAACAVRAAKDGWAVGVNYNSSAGLALEVASAIIAAGGRAVVLPGDVGDESAVRRMFDLAEQHLGPVTGLVNNAGLLHHAGPFHAVSLARWEQTFATNTTGSFLCAREAVRRMIAAKTPGSIVNLSSMAAPLGAPGEFVDYAASKGAVESMTIGLAREVGPLGIRVNAVRPGLIDTDMQAASGDPGRAARLVGSVPLGRVGTAAEVAEAVTWLLSDAASYVTGAILPVSGGR